MLKLTKELAEFLGILIGDGYLDLARNRVIITGNIKKDKLYLSNYVKNLIENLFQVKTIFWKQENKGAYYLCLNSVKIISKLKELNLEKTSIPSIIMRSNKNMKANFLRGLADTDFTIYFKKGKNRKLHSYPVICSTFNSKFLVSKIKSLLSELGIRANIYAQKRYIANKFYNQYDIQIYGRKNLDIWLKNIGFNNARIFKKINLWRRQGFCKPQI